MTQFWLNEAWLLTVASLLEEGDTLLRELEYTPQQAHSSDVLALSEGAEETTQDMAPIQKARHLLRELGGGKCRSLQTTMRKL